MSSRFLRLAGLLVALASAGCATLEPRHGITDAILADKAIITGQPGVRFWGDETTTDILTEIRKRLPNMPKVAQEAQRKGGRPIVEILALSGGGGDGAFGAGLLTGWTKHGTRPHFEVVTGVSAGAIIAPFAFLGPKYDVKLREIWTEYRTSQIATAQVLPGLLGGPALADTGPLRELMHRYIDDAMLLEIADEYRKGRILLVGTTNLDAQRPVVWNMGEIAASNRPGAIQLFRNVILASAAIPGAFPPVEIEVEVDGKRYDELHVDGGTTREVFVSPINAPFHAFDKLYAKPPIRKVFIVKNGKITPELSVVKPQAITIAGRAISTLIKSQSLGELYRIYRMAKDDSVDFNFIAVPETFTVVAQEFFDPAYQKALFEEGYRLGSAGVPWLKQPPDITPAAAPAARAPPPTVPTALAE